jgi:hypothetical protein
MQPHSTPSASKSRQTRRAPQVRSLARKLAFTCWPTASSLRDLALGDRFSQAWKPDRDIHVEAHFDNQHLQQFAFVLDPFDPGFRNAIDAFNLFSNNRFIV